VSEQPVLRIETTTVRTGVNYEAAIMAALIAQDLAGGPPLQPDPERVAERVAVCGIRRPEPEPELEIS
jgi:hypothetical protein